MGYVKEMQEQGGFINTKLNDTNIKIPGYITPIAFEGENVTEFHIREYNNPELREKLQRAGFYIEKWYGQSNLVSEIFINSAFVFNKKIISRIKKFYSKKR